jgi:hypothetical protein
MFDPQQHLIQLSRWVKAPDGHYTTTSDDCLEVKWRLVWFREKFPYGTIDTEEICVNLDREIEVEVSTVVNRRRQIQHKTAKGYDRYRARVENGRGSRTTGTGTETAANLADICESVDHHVYRERIAKKAQELADSYDLEVETLIEG